MRVHGLVLIAFGLPAHAAGADDGAAARSVIEKAILAHGGEAALAKWPAVTVKAKGIFHGHERTPVFFFTSEVTNHGADRLRSVVDGELNGQKFRVAHVLDGDRGWLRLASEGRGETREYTPAQLYESRERGYLAWLVTLLPLKNREFTLTLAGEEEVMRRPAVGVRVSSPGRRDVTLFFDKESGLLVKTETLTREVADVDQKVETFLRSYETVQAVERPMMTMVYLEGRPFWSLWVEEYQLAEKPAEGTFGKP